MGAMLAMEENASPSSVVANVIFESATDGKNQLWYTVGENAKMLIANCQQGDDTFIGGIKA